MTLFYVENSKSVVSVLTLYGNRNLQPHEMSGLATHGGFQNCGVPNREIQ